MQKGRFRILFGDLCQKTTYETGSEYAKIIARAKNEESGITISF